ncbi:MAG: CDP-diacylglycerol--glycerol-3-phosphate 3-phosphatidyltransferase [Thermodesulfobacteriota bacterium]
MSLSTIPNLLTGFRFLVVPFLLFCLRPGVENKLALVGFALFVVAAITDYFDGYLARRWEVQTSFGKLMDPLADKVMVTAVLIMLIPMGRLSALVAFLILARELVVTGLRGVAAASGLVIAASKLGKWKTFIQIVALATLMFPLGVLPIANLHEIGRTILYVALTLTLLSGADYILKFYKQYSPAA